MASIYQWFSNFRIYQNPWSSYTDCHSHDLVGIGLESSFTNIFHSCCCWLWYQHFEKHAHVIACCGCSDDNLGYWGNVNRDAGEWDLWESILCRSLCLSCAGAFLLFLRSRIFSRAPAADLFPVQTHRGRCISSASGPFLHASPIASAVDLEHLGYRKRWMCVVHHGGK